MVENLQRPKVGLGVYIFNDDGKNLIGKRKSEHGRDAWAPPGGHLEFGESFEECAIRETLEETGINIKDIKFAGITNDVFSETGKHYITIAMIARWKSGNVQVMEPDKCEKWEWISWDDFPESVWLPVKNFRKQNKILDFKKLFDC
ncbi:MAG: NUDIX domain-containing protein [Rickettsiales bacterium]|jgi:8-oxo-dGTP diphosphatase|nr:NUDIX domain-containing protein [Rickettsiales bacterium]